MPVTLFTSNFDISGAHPSAVSISGYPPEGWTGRQYRKLAPKRWIYDAYMASGDHEAYTREYQKHVLAGLDPVVVAADLGDGAVLCCYEAPDKFCHRHLVREWLQQAGFHVEEIVP